MTWDLHHSNTTTGVDAELATAGVELGDPESALGEAYLARATACTSWFYNPVSDELVWTSPIEEVLGFEVGVLGFGVHEVGAGGGSDYAINLGESVVAPLLALCRGGVLGGPRETRMVVTAPDGVEHELLVSVAVLAHCDATIYVGTVVDVTAREQMNEAVGTLLDRYRVLSEESPNPVVVHQNGLVVYGNRAALRLIGEESLAENYGRPITDFVVPEDIPATIERLATLSKDGDYYDHGVVGLLLPGGVVRAMDVTSLRTSWRGEPAYQVILHERADQQRDGAKDSYLANLVAHVSDAIIGVNCEGRIESWNDGARRLYGWQAEQVTGLDVSVVLTTEGAVASGWASTMSGADGRSRVANIKRGRQLHWREDGGQVEVTVALDQLRDARGMPSGWVLVCAELADPVQAVADRRAVEARFESVVGSLSEGVVLFDMQGRVCGQNKAAVGILGERLTKWNDYRIFSGTGGVVTQEGAPLGIEAMPHMRALASGVSTEAQVIGLYDDAGNQQWLSLSARVLPDPGGDQELMVVCSFSDISVQLEAERRLRWLAYHDPLTGLGNRMLFNSELESALASAKLRERDLAVLFIDLDRFKMVNDSFGHPSGDEVLAELARRFEALVRADDVVSRFSGDEFVVLCRNPPTLAWARELGEKFLEQSTLPIALSTGHSVMLSCCVGVSFIAKGSCSAEEALSQADTAMFSAKKLGKSQVVVFDGKLAVQATHSVASYRDLHKAVGNGEMEVHFQPIANTTDGRVVGVEALTRWVHPVHGVIAPMDFIPLAEDTDLIFSISNWILHEACGAMARWRQGTPGAEDVYVTVNLSGRQFYSTRLADDLSTCLSEVGLGADGLVVEVTEEMLAANPAGAKVVLADLAAIGVRVAVANYGTGYSSLEQLIQSGISMIKIDRSFVSGSLSEAVTGMAAGAALGNALGMTVVAEGVETSAQLVRAKELGCELYQGYLLGRPVHEWQVAFGARGLVGQR